MKTFFGISSIVTFGLTIIFGVILPIVLMLLDHPSTHGCQGMYYWLIAMVLIPLGLVLSIIGMVVGEIPHKYSRIGFFLNLGFIVLFYLAGFIGQWLG